MAGIVRHGGRRTLLLCAGLCVFLALGAGAQVYAQAADAGVTQPAEPASAGSAATAGIVFNLAPDFRGIDSYQGGVGVKVLLGRSAVRMRLGASWAGASGAISLGLGAAYEYHFGTGIVSPYVGATADAGWLWDGQGATAIPLVVGAILGVEVFPVDFLSFFVEYTGTFGLTFLSPAPGVTPTMTGVSGLSLGNQSRVGIVIYFSRVGGN